jgi:hypothetical protein
MKDIIGKNLKNLSKEELLERAIQRDMILGALGLCFSGNDEIQKLINEKGEKYAIAKSVMAILSTGGIANDALFQDVTLQLILHMCIQDENYESASKIRDLLNFKNPFNFNHDN